jgi:hypothetical protein
MPINDHVPCSINVYYGRTDGTPGYKEYGAVIVRVRIDVPDINYYEDIYEVSDDYEILGVLSDTQLKETYGVSIREKGWVKDQELMHSILMDGGYVKDRRCINCCVDPKEGQKFSRCSKCHLNRYCSTKCQSIDWKAGHKSSCGT